MRLARLAPLLALGIAAAGANLIEDGYSADGSTTYCEQGLDNQMTGIFSTVRARSADRCPLSISLSVNVKSYTMKTVVINVAWNVSLSPNSSSLLYQATPNATDQVPIILPTVQACLVDSYCGTFSDVVLSSLENTFYALDTHSQAPVRMATFELKLDAIGYYVVLARASVSSGKDLVTNVAFQKLRTTTDGSASPGTIRPPRAGFKSPLVISHATTRPQAATPAPQSSNVTSVNDRGTVAASSDLTHHSSTNAVVVAAIAIAGIVVAAVVLAVKRRRDKLNERNIPEPRAGSMQTPVRNHRDNKCREAKALGSQRGSSIDSVAILQSLSSQRKKSTRQQQATATGNWYDASQHCRANEARRSVDDEAFSF